MGWQYVILSFIEDENLQSQSLLIFLEYIFWKKMNM